jgi:hypothetical protein
VNHSDVAPIEGSCSAIGLRLLGAHLLIDPLTRPAASWKVVTPLVSVRAVPVTRPTASWKVVTQFESVRARSGRWLRWRLRSRAQLSAAAPHVVRGLRSLAICAPASWLIMLRAYRLP